MKQLLLTFLIALSLLSIQNFKSFQKVTLRNKPVDITTAPIPTLHSSTYPVISAHSAFAIDLNSRKVLYEKNPDTPLLPASTTKMITAQVALDQYNLSDVITVGKAYVEGQKMKLIPGEQITVENLLYGLLVFSANDAAETLAVNYPGGRPAFIAAMNQKANQAGATASQFKNPSGLDEVGHYSSSRDLAKVAELGLRNPKFAQIVSSQHYEALSTDGNVIHRLTNTNQLLGSLPGVLGVKTGWTQQAHEALVTYVQRDDKDVIVAMLGSQDRFGETKQLVNWIFDNYQWNSLDYRP